MKPTLLHPQRILPFVALLASLATPAAAQVPGVAQSPLHVAGALPGNLALVPSVEYPTIISVANLDTVYDENTSYVGYFDSGKCYQYHYSNTESERHFYPVRTTANHRCTASDAPWSGNFLNWAATQTIDPFRKALTGGYRVRDEPSDNAAVRLSGTWLEKARHDRDDYGLYPNRSIQSAGGSDVISGATPFADGQYVWEQDWRGRWRQVWRYNTLHLRIAGLDNRMRFRLNNSDVNHDVGNYDSNDDCDDDACQVVVRVRVCVPGLLESNCKPYGSHWKPEGTLQEYADRMRYAVIGFLNDSDVRRDGGVLRSAMKFIGPTIRGDQGPMSNPDNTAEWDENTGVQIANPHPGEASATGGATITNSGVINYINKFGQMTNEAHKSHDPVGELYYTAIRYFRDQGNVPSYSNELTYNRADGFPVLANWDNLPSPVQHWCQANVILGIGDIYTHRDKNLPGASCSDGNEPTMPTEVSNDDRVDVVAATNQVGQMEGIGNVGNSCDFTGRGNSAFMAGLAWDARTRDNRPDLTGGKTTISTYWVDVLEAQSLEGMGRNQYALAAKYGGARVPIDFDPDDWGTTVLPDYWWHTNGETLTPFGDRGNGQAAFRRPDNFFVAGEAEQMVDSLTQAFSNIAAELTGSGTSLATTSTRLDASTRSFRAEFYSGSWRGELFSNAIDQQTGALIEPPEWIAGNKLPDWDTRNIRFHDPEGNNQGQLHKLFTRGNLNASQRALFGANETEQTRVVNFLRGDRSNEQSEGGTLRTRTGILGDIVHSEPVFVGAPNPRAFVGRSFTGSNTYANFVNTRAGRRPMVYVGANDGMLHGFDANTGVERYAFIPHQVMQNGLANLALPDYEHRFFVDGELTQLEVYFSGNPGSGWKSVLVGSLGRGGPGLFALDVTDPDNIRFLWEKTAASLASAGADVGANIGKPIIAQIADGDWRVLLGNGPNAAGTAELVMIDVEDGSVDVIDSGATGANGLSAVYTWDTTGDGFTDSAYAGDLQGNLWRFNDLAGSPSTTLLFSQAQPIQAAPLVGRNPATGVRWVFFGTGRYLDDPDKADDTVQTWYGLIDSGAVESGPLIASRDDLVEREIVAEGAIGNFTARVIEAGSAADFIDKDGWYIDLESPVNGAEGERMVVPNFFEDQVLIGTTRIPDASDVCRPSGRGFVMAINPFTGARLTRTFFDISLDGNFDAADLLDGAIVSGVGFNSGPNNPTFVGDFMQTVLDDGRVVSMRTNVATADTRRMSWREIIGN
ncbi:pilus assembly protein [Pseudazoarcus pumilus]|uniref:PilY1 beta-propeller domain-containing protein n=1 Tax=Pseudazoarcus pumilus TaxID=2067960 RepID=A0A2I6S897_9RHOO|nr:PilC/PilY family type IV pilus protein [Pseudazoarcus pumilus]AUN95483.1 hypothetical protein C0099_11430 [Pseudazoarcus pumilus]